MSEKRVHDVQPRDHWVHADFNGLFSEVLCLSHGDTVKEVSGRHVTLQAGMVLTACDPDSDEHGQSDWLLATGVVEPSPDWLTCRGSKWVLRLDENGCRNESDMKMK